MTDTLVWDEAGARYYETGVSKGIFFPIDGSTGVVWNGLTAVNLDPQGGAFEAYYFDGVKYGDAILAEDFQATIQAISTPREFERCEGVREVQFGMRTHFNRRDKFHCAWRTEIGNDEGAAVGYKWHIAYNCLVQPSARAYQTISDNTTPDVRSFVITATPACGRNSYFTFDSRDGDLSALEAQLLVGVLPKCWDLKTLVANPGGPVTPTDDDCPSMLEDFEEYNPGQAVDETKLSTDGTQKTTIHGRINNGFDITELPAVGAFAANDSAASEVGTGDILADDDDATYITSADGDLGYTIGLPPLVGYVPGANLELHIRMSISGDVNADDPDNLDADAQVHISTDAGGDNTIGGFSDGADEGMGFALSVVDGTPVDYVIPLSMDAWVDSQLSDVVTALEAGAYLNVVGASNNNFNTTPEVRIYEASVVMVNATERDKFLRAIPGQSEAWVGQFVLDGSDNEVAANTVTVDFMIKEVPDGDPESTATGQPPISWGDLAEVPGRVSVEISGSDLVIVAYAQDDSTALQTVVIDSNKWYTAEAYWTWGEIKFMVWERDQDRSSAILDYTNSTSGIPDPVAYADHYSGLVGD